MYLRGSTYFNNLFLTFTATMSSFMKQPPHMKRSALFVLFCFVLATRINAQDIFLNKDTTINNTWTIPKGVLLKFGSKGKINGTGTIKGGIIDAALTQWIFDTTITVYPEGTYTNVFSAKWFGAGAVKDNAGVLQKGINTVLSNSGTLRKFFIPRGVYPFSKPLTAGVDVIKSKYSG